MNAVELRFRPETIREAREARGMSRAMLARRLDVRPEAVRDWERGRYRPNVDHLTAVINVLRVHPSALWVRTEVVSK